MPTTSVCNDERSCPDHTPALPRLCEFTTYPRAALPPHIGFSCRRGTVMPVDERKRHLVRTGLEEVHGTEVADALMEMLAPLPWSEVATRDDLDRFGVELRGEMAQLRAELRGEMAELRGELRGMLPRLYAANLAGMIGVAGLVLAASHLG
jgi:hypothetical protein